MKNSEKEKAIMRVINITAFMTTLLLLIMPAVAVATLMLDSVFIIPTALIIYFLVWAILMLMS